jgi:hypothetical protein
MSEYGNLIPASYIFSYWIFVWAVVYIFVKYAYVLSKSRIPKQIEWMNPSLVLLVALIWNTESLLHLITSGKSSYAIFKYGLMIVCIKAIPLWFLWTWDINLYREVSIALIYFAVYCVYLWLNGTDFFAVYEDLTKSIQNDENRTPFEHWIQEFAANNIYE